MRTVYDVKETFQARSAQEVLALLAAHPGAVLVAGGTDVMIRLKKRKLQDAVLIGLQQVPELQGVELEADGTLSIGAGCTFDTLERHPLLLERVPMLAEACHQVGSPQIRVMATIGGNLCNGAVSADSAPALYALDAELEVMGAAGIRRIPVCQFHTGPGRTVLGEDELLLRIRISPNSYQNCGGCYLKFGQRNAMEISTLGCAVNVELTEDRTRIKRAAIAYGVAAPVPKRCYETESRLAGMKTDEEALRLLRSTVLRQLSPRDSWRASKELREQLIRELGSRALRRAIENTGGELG